MPVTVRVWTTPKPDAESAVENEDRFWITGYRPGEERRGPLTVALADGASGSLFAREWAQLLCRVVVRGSIGEADFLEPAVETAAGEWRRETETRRLPWYLEARRAAGAAATLLCVTVASSGEWEAVAVGDTCLMHRRGDRLRTAFPRSRPDDFGSAPELIKALPAGVLLPSVERAGGAAVFGDVLYLMTDALAEWLLRESRGGLTPWPWLDGIASDTDFRERVAVLRGDGRLRGDDTTLIEVRFTES